MIVTRSLNFVAFNLFGSIPLITYIFDITRPFFWASVFTGFSFLLIGSLKSRWALENPLIAAVKTLAMGSCASLIAYGVGALLRNVGL